MMVSQRLVTIVSSVVWYGCALTPSTAEFVLICMFIHFQYESSGGESERPHALKSIFNFTFSIRVGLRDHFFTKSYESA
jgi:hypothetical protein